MGSVTVIKSVHSDKAFIVIAQDNDGSFHAEAYSSSDKGKVFRNHDVINFYVHLHR